MNVNSNKEGVNSNLKVFLIHVICSQIFNSIKSLRKQLDELKLNEKIKKEKKKKQRTEKNESLPSIEQYFIVNNKFQLVDSNKNLWHMKKCMKFQEFKKKY